MSNSSERIKDFNTGRNPHFLALKYAKMMDGAFGFFRGSCHLFYEDLSEFQPFPDLTKAWICGDLHLENFGCYRGSSHQVCYDIEDFDEAVIAPATWEISRTITSIYLAVEEFDLKEKVANNLADLFFASYAKVINKGKPVGIKSRVIDSFIKEVIEESKKNKDLSKLTVVHENKRLLKIEKLAKDSKTAALESDVKEKIIDAVTVWLKQNNYKFFTVLDAANRIAGTGSLGLDRYVILVRDDQQEEEEKKYFLLDMKSAMPSSLGIYTPLAQPEWRNDEAERIETIQHGMQTIQPSFLDKAPPFSRKITMENKSFLLKELQPESDRIKLKNFKENLEHLKEIIDAFAQITASAHLRIANRPGTSTTEELISFFSQSKLWKKSLLDYSKNYVKTVRSQFDGFKTNPEITKFVNGQLEQ